jgi:GGDEF domain-containing protein
VNVYSILVLSIVLVLAAAAYIWHLRRTVQALSYDSAYGMLTRAGGEQALRRLRGPVDVVFFDIDRMHDLNSRLGYERVNSLIRAAFHVRSKDILICRYFSGDELLAVVRAGDGEGFARRISQSLALQPLDEDEYTRLGGLRISATSAVVEGIAPQLAQTIGEASRLVQAAKAER